MIMVTTLGVCMRRINISFKIRAPPCAHVKQLSQRHTHTHLPRQIWIPAGMLCSTSLAALCRRPLWYLLAEVVGQIIPTVWHLAARSRTGWHWPGSSQAVRELMHTNKILSTRHAFLLAIYLPAHVKLTNYLISIQIRVSGWHVVVFVSAVTSWILAQLQQI